MHYVCIQQTPNGQMSTNRAHRSSVALTGDLLTARAVNRESDDLRTAFDAIGVERPAPYIIWDHALNEEQQKRLQQLLCGNGTKADAELLPMIEKTLRRMEREYRKRNAA